MNVSIDLSTYAAQASKCFNRSAPLLKKEMSLILVIAAIFFAFVSAYAHFLVEGSEYFVVISLFTTSMIIREIMNIKYYYTKLLKPFSGVIKVNLSKNLQLTLGSDSTVLKKDFSNLSVKVTNEIGILLIDTEGNRIFLPNGIEQFEIVHQSKRVSGEHQKQIA